MRIKPKKSRFSAFFNNTYTGSTIVAVLSTVAFVVGFVLIPNGVGMLTLFLFRPYMSSFLIKVFTELPWLCGFILSVIISICVFIIYYVCIATINAFHRLKKDMKLASVFQYLPTKEEDWDEINKTYTYPGFKEPEQIIYTTILCIFLELKAGHLLNYDDLTKDSKFSFELYKAIRSGHEYCLHLYRNAAKTEMNEQKVEMYEYLIFVLKNLLQKERNDYILFKIWGKGYEMSSETKEALKRIKTEYEECQNSCGDTMKCDKDNCMENIRN